MKILYKKEKGVSPVIATILMVAITVVLASAVYLMVSGYMHGPSTTIFASAQIQQLGSSTQVTISNVQGGEIIISATSPLLVTVTIPASASGTSSAVTASFSIPSSTITLSPSPSPGGSATISPTPSSSTPPYITISGTLYFDSKSGVTAGSMITLTYTQPATGGGSTTTQLPTGTTITISYSGNTIWTGTVS
ncbi:MAG: archaellin/type IV pilin N-terminal domain-containing protein [Candidatus Nanopusillus acidilobi]